jgi:branched-chain amino acid transport system substrate-binding protein
MRTQVARGLVLVAAMALVASCTVSSSGSGAPSPVISGTPASAAPGGSGATGGTIKIGGGFALTGDESALDLPAANGAKLAVKEINAAGGVLGSQIDFIVHDSQYKMDVTAQTAKQFVEQDKVPVFIGYTDTDSVLAAGPTFQAAKIPFITVGATSPKIPTQVGDMMFLACFGDNVQAAVGAEYSYKTFGHNAYFLWDKGVEYTTLLGGYFKSRFTELGGTIALEESYDDKATDFSAQITKIKALNPKPDFYYVAAMPYKIVRIVKQLREAGITCPIFGGVVYVRPDIVKVAGPTSR